MTAGCLFGAAGVALLALAAHGSWARIDFVAILALAHAPALLAIGAALQAGVLRAGMATGAALLLVAAVALFCVDVLLHTITGVHLFPMAAPIGGSAAICAWLVLAVSAVCAK